MKQIVGTHLIGEAPADEDAQHNTDLVVLRLEAVRIACRVRNESYHHNYGDEFTIRSKRPNGVKTELAKIVEGWGDYVLYGFAPKNGTYMTAWGLGDLNVFRLWFGRQCVMYGVPGSEQSNADGSSKFRAFKWASLPDNFIIAKHQIGGRNERLNADSDSSAMPQTAAFSPGGIP
jgi:hypothetical protein